MAGSPASQSTLRRNGTHRAAPHHQRRKSIGEVEEIVALANVLAVGSTLIGAGEVFLSLIFEERPSHANWQQFMAKAAGNELGVRGGSSDEAARTGKIRAIGNEFCTQLDTPYEDPAST